MNNAAYEQSSFIGQVVVITGAASGIGRASAELIAQRGANVICLDVNEIGLQEVVTKIKSNSGKAISKIGRAHV